MEKEGYVFDGWYIADIEYNRKYFLRPPLKIGEKFNFDKMPDLSPDTEEDGAAIFLEGAFHALQTATERLYIKRSAKREIRNFSIE